MAGEATYLGSPTDNHGYTEVTGGTSQYEVGKGGHVVRMYQGPLGNLNDFLADLIAGGAQIFDVRRDEPATVTARYASASFWAGYPDELQQAIDDARWELIPQVEQRDLFTHGMFNQEPCGDPLGSGADAVKVDDNLGLNTLMAVLKDDPYEAISTDWDATFPEAQNLNHCRNLYLAGVRSYEAYTYTIRRTITVSDKAGYSDQHQYAGHIVDYSNIGVPILANWEQPRIYWYPSYRQIIDLSLSSSGWQYIRVDQWYSKPGSVQWSSAMRKNVITHEWIGGLNLRSSGLYGSL